MPPDAALSGEEVEALLSSVRFGELQHQELLQAVEDPLLAEARLVCRAFGP